MIVSCHRAAVDRLREVAQRLTDPGNRNLTILGIVLDAGFNCSASFHRCFKREFGLTPSAFIKEKIPLEAGNYFTCIRRIVFNFSGATRRGSDR